MNEQNSKLFKWHTSPHRAIMYFLFFIEHDFATKYILLKKIAINKQTNNQNVETKHTTFSWFIKSDKIEEKITNSV